MADTVSFIPTTFAKKANESSYVLHLINPHFIWLIAAAGAKIQTGKQLMGWPGSKSSSQRATTRWIICSLMGTWFGKRHMRWVPVGNDTEGCIKGTTIEKRPRWKLSYKEAKLWRRGDSSKQKLWGEKTEGFSVSGRSGKKTWHEKQRQGEVKFCLWCNIRQKSHTRLDQKLELYSGFHTESYNKQPLPMETWVNMFSLSNQRN